MWEISDGTRVALDATITGSGEVAEQLRAELRLHREGVLPIRVQHAPPPAPGRPLDLRHAPGVHQWIVRVAQRLGCSVTRVPPELQVPEPAPPVPPERIY